MENYWKQFLIRPWNSKSTKLSPLIILIKQLTFFSISQNLNFVPKFQFWSEISILLNKKSQFWSEISILLKNFNFSQKSRFCSEMSVLFKNLNFCQKSQFGSKISILFRNVSFGQKSEFCSEMSILFKNLKNYMTIEHRDFSI